MLWDGHLCLKCGHTWATSRSSRPVVLNLPNTVPHVVWPPNIILLLLHYCNIVTDMNYIVNIWYMTPRGSRPTGWEPWTTGHCQSCGSLVWSQNGFIRNSGVGFTSVGFKSSPPRPQVTLTQPQVWELLFQTNTILETLTCQAGSRLVSADVSCQAAERCI